MDFTAEAFHDHWYYCEFQRSHVFKWDGNPSTRWKKIAQEDNIRIELPTDTLIEVEIVQEMKGEVWK